MAVLQIHVCESCVQNRGINCYVAFCVFAFNQLI